MVLVCPPNRVASLGVAVWGLGVRLLDPKGGPAVLRCLWVYGRGVSPLARSVYAVQHLGYPSHRVEGVVGARAA